MDCNWYNSSHCRSCELLDKSYAATLTLKEKKLAELFPDSSLNFLSTVGLEKAEGSRNKAKLAAFSDTAEDIQFGFYDGHLNFKALESCPLHMMELNAILPVIEKKLSEYKITPYSLTMKKGELKYLIISRSDYDGSLLLRFVLRSKESLDRLRKMSDVLQAEFSSVKVVTANIQPEHKAILEGEEEIVLSSKSSIIHKFNDVILNLGPRSFFQVTPEIAGKLYSAVGEIVQKFSVTSFLDLYCGVGAFSFFAAKHCPQVLGVEISKEAISCADLSVQQNKVTDNISFQALDVEEFLKSKKQKFDSILVNPPRRGLNPDIIKNILENDPRILIYSSCNAETLARDYQLLKNKYEILSLQIFDMFPYTEHFETLMILNRKGT